MVGHRQQKGLLLHHAKRGESTGPVSQLPVGGNDALHLAAAPRRYIQEVFTDLVRIGSPGPLQSVEYPLPGRRG